MPKQATFSPEASDEFRKHFFDFLDAVDEQGRRLAKPILVQGSGPGPAGATDKAMYHTCAEDLINECEACRKVFPFEPVRNWAYLKSVQ